MSTCTVSQMGVSGRKASWSMVMLYIQMPYLWNFHVVLTSTNF